MHNGMFDERTLAVLCAEQVADVIVGVNFARDNAEQETIRRIRQCMAARRRAVGLDVAPVRMAAPAAVPANATGTTQIVGYYG